jgi:photosystem II stability/assembly factor-like uncharacterized protein
MNALDLSTVPDGIIDHEMTDQHHLWAVTSSGRIWATTDGGTTFKKQFVDSTKTRFMNYIKMFDSKNGVAMGDGLTRDSSSAFLRTTNGGTTWTSVNTTSVGGLSRNEWKMISFPTPDVGYFFSWTNRADSLYKTTDGGSTWKALKFPFTGCLIVHFPTPMIGMAISFGNDNAAYIVRTKDGGQTWETFALPAITGYPDEDFENLPENIGSVWFLTSKELLFSSDTGRTWTIQRTVVGHDIQFTNYRYGWLVGENTILYTSDGGGKINGVSRERLFASPNSFALKQNYPNPFNPSTTIQYGLPILSSARLIIYNMLGQIVSELVNTEQQAGYQSVVWNANVSSGLYFYRLEATSLDDPTKRFVETKKMLLLK